MKQLLILVVLIGLVVLVGCDGSSSVSSYSTEQTKEINYFCNVGIGSYADYQYFHIHSLDNKEHTMSIYVSREYEYESFICYYFHADHDDYLYYFINKKYGTIYKIIRVDEKLPFITQKEECR